jgi:hypothetical protein
MPIVLGVCPIDDSVRAIFVYAFSLRADALWNENEAARLLG